MSVKLPRVHRRQWRWRFEAPRNDVWGVLADTARLNEAAGLGKHVVTDLTRPDGSVEHRGNTRFGFWSLEWRRDPTDWVAGKGFVQRTEFLGGPLKAFTFRLNLLEEGQSTVCDYEIEIEAGSLLGIALSPLIARRLERSYQSLKASVALRFRGIGDPIPMTLPHPAPKLNNERIEVALDDMLKQGADEETARRIGELIKLAQEVDLRHIRPLALARHWDRQPRQVVEACLIGTSAGLLGMQWDLLCPRCRGAKVSVARLGDLPREAHCPSCNVAYERDFAKNVELTFHPSKAVRPIDSGEFCLFGPLSTPHVKLQTWLNPSEDWAIEIALDDGEYRVRPLYGGGVIDIVCRDGRTPSVTIGDVGFSTGPEGDPGFVQFANQSDRPVMVSVESKDWIRDALTAHRATALQAFRDIFGSDVLRPDDDASIERITLMFTDLRGSTALYSQMGDAAAYRFVQSHFTYIAERVRRNDGALFKTIGDAVMAAFADPADAVRAAIEIQSDIYALNTRPDAPADHPVAIKVGLSQGPAIAVTLNDRLDYFGGTANKAARLSGLSLGEDIVMSWDLAGDPAIQAELGGIATEECAEAVKGFDVPIRYVRAWPPPTANFGQPVTSLTHARALNRVQG